MNDLEREELHLWMFGYFERLNYLKGDYFCNGSCFNSNVADLSQATVATLNEMRAAFALDDASPKRRVNGVWYTGK